MLGIASIFTYGMKKSIDRLAAAQVQNVSLTDFDVVARVAAVLKRTASQPLSYNDLKLDVAAKRATIGTTDLQLTKTEFEILALLLSKPETVFSAPSASAEKLSS